MALTASLNSNPSFAAIVRKLGLQAVSCEWCDKQPIGHPKGQCLQPKNASKRLPLESWQSSGSELFDNRQSNNEQLGKPNYLLLDGQLVEAILNPYPASRYWSKREVRGKR